MARIEMNGTMSREVLRDIIKANLAEPCQITVRINGLRIVRSGLKGCLVSLKTTGDRTTFSVGGFMPSIPLRLFLLLGVFALGSLVVSAFKGGVYISFGGFIPFLIVMVLLPVPSRPLVLKIERILHAVAASSPDSSQPVMADQAGAPATTRKWLWIGGSIAGLLIVVTALLWNNQTDRKVSDTSPADRITPVKSPVPNRGAKMAAELPRVVATGMVRAKREYADGTYDDDAFEVLLVVAFNDIRRLKIGQPAEVTLTAHPGWRIPGRIVAIRPNASFETRTMEVLVELAIADPRMMPKMAAMAVFLPEK